MTGDSTPPDSDAPGARLPAFLMRWHGIGQRASGPAALRRALARLQGAPVPVSELESAILSTRLDDATTGRLDELLQNGELIWQGIQPLGRHDGQIALYLAGDFPFLGRISVFAPGAREQRVREALVAEPGIRFDRLNEQLGGFGDDLLRTLWNLAWNGEAASDSLDALRARRSATAARYHRRPRPRYTTRKRILPGAAGRWRLLSGPDTGFAPQGEREQARARLLLDRYGIVCRRMLAGEEDGFDVMKPLLERLAAAGRAERGDPLGTGEPQFLAPGAAALWNAPARDEAGGVLAACDPACPWGLLAPWPGMASGHRPQRVAGARVLFRAGRLLGYVTRSGRELHTPLAGVEPAEVLELLERCVAGPVFLESVNGEPPYRTAWHGALLAAGFSPSRRGYLLRAGR